MCSENTEKNDWLAETNDGTDVPSRLYSLNSLRSGREEANPNIYPGDLIVVQKAAPVYVIGEVNILKEIPLTETGLSLTEAIAQSGGFSREAKTKTVRVRRLNKIQKTAKSLPLLRFDQKRRAERYNS